MLGETIFVFWTKVLLYLLLLIDRLKFPSDFFAERTWERLPSFCWPPKIISVSDFLFLRPSAGLSNRINDSSLSSVFMKQNRQKSYPAPRQECVLRGNLVHTELFLWKGQIIHLSSSFSPLQQPFLTIPSCPTSQTYSLCLWVGPCIISLN